MYLVPTDMPNDYPNLYVLTIVTVILRIISKTKLLLKCSCISLLVPIIIILKTYGRAGLKNIFNTMQPDHNMIQAIC